MKKKVKKKEEIFTTGSGNVFRDLGFSSGEAAVLTIKATLFNTLKKALRESGKTQKELAEILKVPQPKISDLSNGKMSGFSIERIANYLFKMNYNIVLEVEPAVSGKEPQVIQRRSVDISA